MAYGFMGELTDRLIQQLEIEGLSLSVTHQGISGLLAELLVVLEERNEEAGVRSVQGAREQVKDMKPIYFPRQWVSVVWQFIGNHLDTTEEGVEVVKICWDHEGALLTGE